MYDRILVPLDGSRFSQEMLPYAAGLATGLDIPLVLLRLVSKASEQGEATGYVENLAAAHGAQGLCSVAGGDVADAILAEAERVPGTLVAMTSHGRSGLLEAMLGSVALRVVRGRNGAPVLVYRPTGAAEAERPAFALLHDAATLAPILRGESPLRANEWPALELSPAALTRLCEDLEPHAREAWNTLAQGRPPSPPSAHAPARLIAAVERRLAAFPPTNATRAAFDELAAGAPVDTLTWGLAARDAIARFCALAEDAASGDATLLSAAGSHAAEALILLGEQ